MEDYKIIDSYSRKEAVSYGFQVRIPDQLRKEAGVNYPVFVTRTVWDKYLKVPIELSGHQDLEGRIWDMLFMFRMKARKNPSNFLTFEVVFQMPDNGDWEANEKVMEQGKKTFREVTLEALAGPTDMDDLRPAITIMKPGED